MALAQNHISVTLLSLKYPILICFKKYGLVSSSLNNTIFISTKRQHRIAVGGEERLEAFCTQLTEFYLNPL